MRFNIYDYGKEIFSEDCVEVVKTLTEKNRIITQDVENMLVYFRRVSSPNFNNDAIIRADIKQIAEGSVLDAEGTKAFFWLASALQKFGLMNKIEPDHVREIAPKLMMFLQANTKATELRAKKLKTLTDFTKTFAAQTALLHSGKCTADEAMEKLTAALPDVNAAKEEMQRRPDFEKLIDGVTEISQLCADPSYAEKICEYRNKLYDN